MQYEDKDWDFTGLNTNNYFGGNEVQVNAKPNVEENIPQLDAPVIVDASPDDNPYMVENNYFNNSNHKVNSQP